LNGSHFTACTSREFSYFFPFNSFHNKCVIEANERQEPGIWHTDGTLTLKIGFFSVGFGENKLFFREFGLIKLRYSKRKTSSNIKHHLQFSTKNMLEKKERKEKYCVFVFCLHFKKN